MADKVNHWPSWANWCTRDKFKHDRADIVFHRENPYIYGDHEIWQSDGMKVLSPHELELVEVDPATPWDQSLQRRPKNV